jgi:hypothetical protein
MAEPGAGAVAGARPQRGVTSQVPSFCVEADTGSG